MFGGGSLSRYLSPYFCTSSCWIRANAMQIAKRLHDVMRESNRCVFVLSEIFYFATDTSIQPNHSLSIYLDLKSVSEALECFA